MKQTLHDLFRYRIASFFVMPTRLADGLEAKKSSSVMQIRPGLKDIKAIGSPVLKCCCSSASATWFEKG
ncbi:MAG TPA: hypothetical protein DDW24_08860 [Blastocatellia bacterium]|nr:hypothetical protein [Blastocatellia bacterium]